MFSGLTALATLSLGGNPTDPLPFTVTVEKVGTNQVRAKVLAGAPFAVDIPVTVVDGTLAAGATMLRVAAGAVEGTAVTVTRTAGTTAAVTVDVDLSTPPTLPRGHTGYAFAKATTGLPATILPDAGASSDATLSDLVVNDGNANLTLTPAFASDKYTYRASVTNDVAEVTVTAMTTDSGVTIEYLDGDDATLTDANTSDPGHQVALAVGNYVIQVKVTAADGNTTATYMVTVNRAVDAVVPVVTIAADKTVVWDFEGTAGFTLSRTGPTAATLTVTVEVTQEVDRDLLPDGAEAERTVTFAVNSATTALSVALENDDLSELAGDLTVEVQAGSGYTVGDPASATVEVRDGDEGNPQPANLMAEAGAGVGEVALSWDAHAPHLTFHRHQYRYKTDGNYAAWTHIPNSGQHTGGMVRT